MKLQNSSKWLEMSGRYLLNVVIGYELVSYLLHYSSALCVTFKELFNCKGSSKIGDSEINPLLFYSPHIRFSIKADWYRRNTIARKRVSHKRVPTTGINGEKGFASSLNEWISFQTDGARPISFALMPKWCFYGISAGFLFSLSICAGAESRPWPPVPWMGQAVTNDRQTGRMPYLTTQMNLSQQIRHTSLCMFARFHTSGMAPFFFWLFLSDTDFLLGFLSQYASASVYLHFRAFQLVRIRWSFSFWAQR